MRSTNAKRTIGEMIAALEAKVSLQRIGGGLLIFLAILLRTRQFLFNRSLWGDEAMLALNIVKRDFAGFFQPLLFDQSAPLGFLVVEKLSITLFGNHDYILRLFPFLAGLAAVFIMFWLARRIFPGWKGLAAFGLFVFSWQAVYYASEVKQYGSDVLCTLGLLAAARLCNGPQVPRRNWLLLMGAGALSLWMSHPALFTIAAIVTVLGIANLLDKNCRNLYWLFGASLFWVINFLCIYFLSLRHSAASRMLHTYWQKAFMPLPPWNDWSWFLRSGELIFDKLLDIPFIFGLAILLAGIFYMFRADWKRAVLWLTPFLAALLASGAGLYPIWPRFLLFALPMLCFFLAAGLGTLHTLSTRFLSNAGNWITVIVAVVVFWQPVAWSVKKFQHPENMQDIKSIMAILRANRRWQDTIYVHHSAKKQFAYYANFYGIGRKRAVIGARAVESASPLIADIKKLAGNRRVWFMFPVRISYWRFDQEAIMRDYLNSIGTHKERYRAKGFSLDLYDLSRK
jgi:hypothetical protein